MDLDIRQAVLQNLNNATHDDVEATIKDAISIGEDKTLPGLGVLFELLWNNASVEWKNDCTNKLVKYLN